MSHQLAILFFGENEFLWKILELNGFMHVDQYTANKVWEDCKPKDSRKPTVRTPEVTRRANTFQNTSLDKHWPTADLSEPVLDAQRVVSVASADRER